ncbi:MAG TPA: hypothetical protein VFK44_08515 [Bacillales bacterium]|nr:hypothetical protein [Bacillales bacterium]
MPEFTWIIVLVIIGLVASYAKNLISAETKREFSPTPVSPEGARERLGEEKPQLDQTEILVSNDFSEPGKEAGDRRIESEEHSTIRSQEKIRPHETTDYRHLSKRQLRDGFIIGELLNEKPRAKEPHPAIIRYTNEQRRG